MGHLPSEKKAITGKCNGYTHKQQIQIPPLTPPPPPHSHYAKQIDT